MWLDEYFKSTIGQISELTVYRGAETMSKRKIKEQTEYSKNLNKYHKCSPRHVLVLEADISEQLKRKVFHYSELERKASNELIAIMRNNFEQLIRTKRYRKLKKLYGKYKEKGDNKKLSLITGEMTIMQKQYGVTWESCRKAMIPIQRKYGIDAIFALTRAEDIWRGVEKCLFSDGRKIRFIKKGYFPCIRAKQTNRGIIISIKDGKLVFRWNKEIINVKIKDRFETDEVNAVLSYLSDSDAIDKTAVDKFQKEGRCISTYRPCYAVLICKTIRGKLRVYVHLIIEGNAMPKYKRSGEKRHKYNDGAIGCDIGTQTIAYTSDYEVGLKNLAERGRTITSERKRRIYRAMDRSRRATNPQNYNEDGTVKKGHKTWKESKRYKKLKAKHKELCRINAENRRLAINEDVNRLRSLGNIFVTEPKNAKKLQKRAKNTTINKNGKYNRKKRFGKSIQNRCPGYFQMQVKKKFENTGGVYIEVPSDYKASQYDHTCDNYIKKKLSERMYRLSDGTLVQRDWYSSFLLYNIDFTTMTINKNKCNKTFATQYEKAEALIEYIKLNHIKVLNSGIKIV